MWSSDPEERVTQWLDAARGGNHELVAQLLRESPELVGAVDYDVPGLTALHCAVINGHSRVVELLLAANPLLVHVVDAHGRTALHMAAERRRPNRYDAEKKNNVLIMEQLLEAGPCSDLIKAVDCDGMTALDYARENDSWETMARILVEDPTLASQADPWGKMTALHHAVKFGVSHKGVARLLREHPDMIHAVDIIGSTALHGAAHLGTPEVMSLLLAVASPELIKAVDGSNQNALHLANHPEIAAQLLAASPELIHGVDNGGQTVLHRVAARGWVDFAAKLLAVKPELIDQVDNFGRLALHAAVIYGNSDMMEMLFAVKPEHIHAVDKLGFNVLHLTTLITTLSEEFIARLLTLVPSALHAVDNKGQTPFVVAVASMNYHSAVRVMQPKLVFDVVVGAFDEAKMDHTKQLELLSPVLKEQCGCLLEMLNQDVVSVVCEYLGFKELMNNNLIVHVQSTI